MPMGMPLRANAANAPAFKTPSSFRPVSSRTSIVTNAESEEKEVSPSNKAVWYATEALGRARSLISPTSPPSKPVDAPPTSIDEAITRLQADYEGTAADPRPYFLTGRMDEALYAEDCVFADPFVAFTGRQRFVDNLANLAGGFITDASTRLLETSIERGDAAAGVAPTYRTKLMVKLQLGLPWKPVIAWPWGVTHTFDAASGLIVDHRESWDVSAAEGVRQLLRPGPSGGLRHGRAEQ